VWGELLDEESVKFWVFAYSKERPDVRVREGGEGGELEFEEVILSGADRGQLIAFFQSRSY
jgi:hypothetical protein